MSRDMIKKLCDNCGTELGLNGGVFLQLHGSFSEQIEDSDGRVAFRYLTPRADSKMAFCDDECEQIWKDIQRKRRGFIERPSYPQG